MSAERRAPSRRPTRPGRAWATATVGVVAWGALAFGAPYPWAYTPLAIAAAAVGLAGLARGTVPLPRLTVSGLGLIGMLAMLQVVPMPRATAAELSPASERLLIQHDVAYALRPPPSRPLSISPTHTWLAVGLLAAFSLLLAGTARIATRDAVRAMAWGVVVLGVSLGLIALLQRATFATRIYGFWKPEMSDVFFGPFVNKNHFAGWMLMAIPLGLGLVGATVERAMRGDARTWRERVLWMSSPEANQVLLVVFAVLVMALSLVLTLSRSGIASLAAALALSAAFALRHGLRSRRIVGVAAVAVIGVIALGWVGVDTVLQHFANADASTFNGRMPIWADTLRIVHDFPLTGTGLNTYGVATLFYQTVLPGKHLAEAHNDYLQLAAEGGLMLGVPLVLTVLLYTVEVRGRMRVREGSTYWLRLGAITGILAIALQSTVEFSLQMPGNAALFAVLCGIALRTADQSVTPS